MRPCRPAPGFALPPMPVGRPVARNPTGRLTSEGGRYHQKPAWRGRVMAANAPAPSRAMEARIAMTGNQRLRAGVMALAIVVGTATVVGGLLLGGSPLTVIGAALAVASLALAGARLAGEIGGRAGQPAHRAAGAWQAARLAVREPGRRAPHPADRLCHAALRPRRRARCRALRGDRRRWPCRGGADVPQRARDDVRGASRCVPGTAGGEDAGTMAQDLRMAAAVRSAGRGGARREQLRG